MAKNDLGYVVLKLYTDEDRWKILDRGDLQYDLLQFRKLFKSVKVADPDGQYKLCRIQEVPDKPARKRAPAKEKFTGHHCTGQKEYEERRKLATSPHEELVVGARVQVTDYCPGGHFRVGETGVLVKVLGTQYTVKPDGLVAIWTFGPGELKVIS